MAVAARRLTLRGGGLAVLLVLIGMAESYMTNYVCNTSYELVEKQNLSRTAEPGKVEFFCKDYVNYTAVCDTGIDPNLGFNPSCNNTFAIQVFANLQRALSVYSCREYSRIWTCDNCRSIETINVKHVDTSAGSAAYKRWLCASIYRKCAWEDPSLPGHQCPTNFTRTNYQAIPDCVVKTCQDVCYDVVRKCPVNLGFQCPPVNDIREYDVSNCEIVIQFNQKQFDSAAEKNAARYGYHKFCPLSMSN
ncbi:hypothetical protein GUITHDRAFT_144277 [Guillardia theta CCMP2712]|uniref:FZ domain-containing protein n=1 Tax=Guillardia theta (strain CCMP2712) TaxID=905079 RepID=L1IQJ9_GUITC|nr:hypothetical protein GUITHDRAFT_144277 [Guillardia theta CCMP2712]EKX38337.1 hypothetical protein GUITHDRAFT_144277 [Guillardia theta CCMP2712]|eukprot:XP_005825317.1 hypothetical protein GUITHDRAFT_144277 [Guillardia theta CCMP2712]